MPAPTYSSYFLEPVNENCQTFHHGIKPLNVNPLQNIVFVGASDQNRLGDQLRPHVYSRLFQPEFYRCAGLVSKNLSDRGGHEVINYGEAAFEMEGKAFSLVHMGGDSFFTGLISAYNHAVEGKEKKWFTSLVQVTAREEMTDYVRRRSGQKDSLAYVVAPRGCFERASVSFFGIRLPDASILEEEQEAHFLSCVDASFFVGVSGAGAEDYLSARGIRCVQMPCALSALPTTCDGNLRQAAGSESGMVQRLSSRFPKGWMVVENGGISENQASDFGQAITSLAKSRGWGVVVLPDRSVGAARLETCLEHLRGDDSVVWLEGSDIWEVTAVLSKAQLYVGSCLDTRILAMAFSVPRINHPRADRRIVDYCEKWESPTLAFTLGENSELWREELDRAADAPCRVLRGVAKHCGEVFRSAIGQMELALTTRCQLNEETDHYRASKQGQKAVSRWGKDFQNRKMVSGSGSQAKGRVEESAEAEV